MDLHLDMGKQMLGQTDLMWEWRVCSERNECLYHMGLCVWRGVCLCWICFASSNHSMDIKIKTFFSIIHEKVNMCDIHIKVASLSYVKTKKAMWGYLSDLLTLSWHPSDGSFSCVSDPLKPDPGTLSVSTLTGYLLVFCYQTVPIDKSFRMQITHNKKESGN